MGKNNKKLKKVSKYGHKRKVSKYGFRKVSSKCDVEHFRKNDNQYSFIKDINLKKIDN